MDFSGCFQRNSLQSKAVASLPRLTVGDKWSLRPAVRRTSHVSVLMAALEQVENDYSHRDRNDQETDYTDHQPRSRTHNLVYAVFDPVQQFWVGGVT